MSDLQTVYAVHIDTEPPQLTLFSTWEAVERSLAITWSAVPDDCKPRLVQQVTTQSPHGHRWRVWKAEFSGPYEKAIHCVRVEETPVYGRGLHL